MKIISDFYSDEKIASSFFKVQKTIYPHLNLQLASEWKLLANKVTPFAVIDDEGQILSILNASQMQVCINGNLNRALQIGTVATLPDQGGKGYAGMLQTFVQNKLAKEFDFIFLFANSSVLDFYPKYGFRARQQVVHKYYIQQSGHPEYQPLKLDIDGLNLLKDLLDRRDGISNKMGVLDSQWLTEFYCRTFFKDNLWVNVARDTIVVATVDGSVLKLQDIIANKLPYDFFINLSWYGISEIHLGFTPDKFNGDFDIEALPDDEQIFVCGDFPEDLSEFKFPALAYT